MSAQATGAPTIGEDPGVAGPRRRFLPRFVTGDLAEARVIIALAVIWIIFQVQ